MVCIFWLIFQPAYAGTCRDNQFNFERIVRPFGNSLKNLRDSVFRTNASGLTSTQSKVEPGQWVDTIGRSVLGMGAYLEVLPPWYSERTPTLKEFYYDMSYGAKVNATEALSMLSTLRQYAIKTPGDRSYRYEPKLTGKILAFLQQSSYKLGYGFGFLPFHISKLQTPVARILTKQFNTKGYKPTATEIETLKKYEMYEAYLEREAFLKSHPIAHRLKYGSHLLVRTALFASLIAVLNHFLYMAEEDAIIGDEEFLSLPAFSPDSEQVQLVVDMVPFPHLAIRIGNEIYSYGTTHLSKMSDSEYVRARKLREVNFDIGKPREEKPIQIDTGSKRRLSYDGFAKFIEKTGLDKLPLSVQVVTLNLGRNETMRVRAELERSLGKRYINETGVNDCATMVMRVLNMENQLVDASPSQVLMWFTMQKRMGSDVVESVKTVMIEDQEHPGRHLYRNAAINYLESFYFARLFVMNQAHRFYIDAQYPESSDLQFYSDKMQKVVDSYEAETRKNLDEDQIFYKYKLKWQRVSQSGDPEKIKEFQMDLNRYVEKLKREAEAILANDNEDILPSILAEHRLKIIDDYKMEILKPLQ